MSFFLRKAITIELKEKQKEKSQERRNKFQFFFVFVSSEKKIAKILKSKKTNREYKIIIILQQSTGNWRVSNV